MVRPSPEVIEQFTRLRNSAIHKYMTASLESVRDGLESVIDEQTLRTMQGEAKTLRSLLKLVEGLNSASGL